MPPVYRHRIDDPTPRLHRAVEKGNACYWCGRNRPLGVWWPRVYKTGYTTTVVCGKDCYMRPTHKRKSERVLRARWLKADREVTVAHGRLAFAEGNANQKLAAWKKALIKCARAEREYFNAK